VREGVKGMYPGWVTVLLLAFGIAVAIIGVIAYLRLFRKEKLSSASPGAIHVGSSSRVSAGEKGNCASQDAISEQETRTD